MCTNIQPLSQPVCHTGYKAVYLTDDNQFASVFTGTIYRENSYIFQLFRDVNYDRQIDRRILNKSSTAFLNMNGDNFELDFYNHTSIILDYDSAIEFIKKLRHDNNTSYSLHLIIMQLNCKQSGIFHFVPSIDDIGVYLGNYIHTFELIN